MGYEFGSHGYVRSPIELSMTDKDHQQLQLGEIPEDKLRDVHAVGHEFNSHRVHHIKTKETFNFAMLNVYPLFNVKTFKS